MHALPLKTDIRASDADTATLEPLPVPTVARGLS